MTYYDLGTYSRTVATGSSDAQVWFDRGLNWIYAYNHEAAIACFQKALAADPGCAMANWGIAYAAGPTYIRPWETFEPSEKSEALAMAREAIAGAREALDRAGPVERGLIDAIAHLWPEEPVEDLGPWNDAFAAAMRDVHHAHPDDLDVATVFAEAMMNRTPWQLWDLPTGRPADGADTMEAVTVLDRTFSGVDGAWDHPGLLHMYIHLMEMSPHPERALRHGDRLATLAPDAGHLLHMPTHIDVLCGDYHGVVARNERAIAADRIFRDREGADNFYTVLRCHDYHFKIYGAMFLGQPDAALATADELAADLPEPVLRPMADWFEAFVAMKQHVLVRFGMWEEVLAEALPADRELYAVTTALMRYARTVALANLGRIAEAGSEREAFLAARDAVPESRLVFNNTCLDILKIADALSLGELEYHKGNHDVAFGHLRRAVELDDNLPYDEPWGWMQPARHALGALLLDQGRLAEAEAVYRADLGLDATLARACQHPRNVWSLQGLYECLVRREEKVEVLHVKQQLDQAAARATVPVRASCYCRRMAA